MQLCLLVRLLSNIFPYRTVTTSASEDGPPPSSASQPFGELAGARVQTYHKSVLDWLLGEGGMQAGKHAVNAVLGHMLLAGACNEVLAHAPLQVVPPHLQPGSNVVLEVKYGELHPKHGAAADGLLPQYTSFIHGHVGAAYAVRHAVAHACMYSSKGQIYVAGAHDSAAVEVEGVLLNVAMWETAYATGERALYLAQSCY